MPASKFWHYVKMLPVLKARESLTRIQDVSYAFGSMTEERGQEFITKLNGMAAGRSAEEIEEVRVIRPKSPEEMMALMGTSGQHVVMTQGPQTAGRR